MTEDMLVEFDAPIETASPLSGEVSAEAVTTAIATRAEAPPTVAGDQAAQVFSMIERLTLDTSIPIERAEQAFSFWQKVQADQARRAFIKAFSACQSEMEPVARDARNPQTSKRYASLAALDRAIRPIYTKHGFAVSFDAADSPYPDHVRVICYLTHEAGHERIHHADMPCDGKGARGGEAMTRTHAMGSALTYGKRYVLGNAFNIASESDAIDDDGNAASGRTITHSKFITPEQVAMLEKIARDVGADLARFCKFGKVESLAHIHANKFESAKSALLEKRRHAGGAQ